MSNDIDENYAEIQKLASKKLEFNADKTNMENLADLFADKIQTDFFATSNLHAQLDEAVHLCQFGGNVVSCSAASAVLDVIEEKGLMPKSFILSGYICEQLAALQHPLLISTRWNLPRSQAPRRTLLPV